VEKHADFQMVYYGQYVGADPNKREKHRGHIFFDDCVTFCERWDQSSFDPEYDTMPLSHFTERVHKVFARRPYDPRVLRPGVREKLAS
jgi:predicted HD phosphohydrolase